jgi:GH24 family phage-related lysozyme (muramidase)
LGAWGDRWLEALASLVPRLKSREAWRPYAYIDSRGYITIGWGHNLGRLILPPGVNHANCSIAQGNGITREVGETLLNIDVTTAIRVVDDQPWTEKMDSVRREVLAELVFNMGPKVLGFPVFVEQLKQRQYILAALNMRGWDWYGQVHAVRAEPLCRMMSGGVRE